MTVAERGGGVSSLGDGSLEEVVETETPVLVEFYTEWCGSCQQMDPVLESVAAETAVTVLKVDIEDHLETAIEYGAQRTPTLLLFVDGRPVKQLRGAQTEQRLRDLLDTNR
jgi:thioredoxin 1